MALEGSERKILHAILRDQGEALAGYVEDSKIAEIAYLTVEEVRDCLETLEGKECVQRSLGVDGYSAYITAKGRQELRRSQVSGNDQGEYVKSPLKIVPKGLRSFDAEDRDFFLELLPGPRRGDGLPESVHFWKVRIEEMDPDRTFRVGYIFGPSGCGKSSLVKAGLLPRLAKPIIPIYVEATGDETEARLLRGLRKHNPDLPADLDLLTTLVASRERIRPGSNKFLLVIDQFEQWYHAKGAERETELAGALSECDGGRVQAIILVRDDFSMALHRFMAVIGVRQNQDQNFAVVDLFDLHHARKVLIAFGRGYGMLPDDPKEMTGHQNEFLDRTIKGLSQEGRVISVRLALFAEMLKGKPWTPETLKQVGGAEGVGVTFLEETLSAHTAPPSYRIHQKAAQAVLKALLPETGSNIKGNMRSYEELLEVSGYGSRPREFDELIRTLNSDLRLITPSEPEGSEIEGETRTQPGEKYFLLTHDYLVPSIREWLTRKQKETRRGRAELRLVERSSLWNGKPDNRHLPSAWEWASIRLMTATTDWTEPQRKMMKRAGRVHRFRGLVTIALLGVAAVAGFNVRRRIIENQAATYAGGLVDSILDADIRQIPEIMGKLPEHRHWVDPLLRKALESAPEGSRQQLHARLGLLPVDARQLDPLSQHLLVAAPTELAALRDVLRPHRLTLIPKLWLVIDGAKPGDESVLRPASALADYDATSPRWESVVGKVAQALVTVNPVYLGDWLEALRPVRAKLNTPLAAIYRGKNHPDSERTLATNILIDYASDDPNVIADLLMDADTKAYAAVFDIAQRHEAKTLSLVQAEMAKKPESSWNDSFLDPSWTKPDAALIGRIEAAQGMLADRYGFCQTVPLDEFPTIADALRKSGYRPIRFRPYADGKFWLAAVVWTRDGSDWRLEHNQTADALRQSDEQNRKAGLILVDVAGYPAASSNGGKPTSQFAALWVQKAGRDDDARMVLATNVAELTSAQDQFKNAGLFPQTFQTWRQADDQVGYCGVWGKTTGAMTTTHVHPRSSLAESELAGVAAEQAGTLIDLGVCSAPSPISTKERATADLQAAESALKAKSDDLNARFSRATAAEIMKAGHLDRSYTAVWVGDVRFEALPLLGLDPTAHLQRCRELDSQGYRMVAISVARTFSEGPPITASLWHRPVITEEAKDHLAERQARAAIALLRTGKPAEVMQHLNHSADPRLRSFIINWLSPLGAEPRAIAAELDRLPAAPKPTASQGQQFMDAVMFHPENSKRRALIMALGTYAMERVSFGDRMPLISKLLDLYRNDPDSGTHGASAWTLRRWGQGDMLETIDTELMKLKDRGDRRWYVNIQGQTFAVIEGPVEFRMGSQPTEPNHNETLETPRRVIIPRRFAIATKEVTVEQWQRFERTNPQYRLAPSYVNQYSPDRDGPMIAFTWYIAAHYCNWLSEQEGLPKHQWCYLPNEADAYAGGMTIPADVLQRRGYRLPTEAEWEYACRSGSVTNYYFGMSIELLDKYAWYQANSKEHAWACASLLPNDLGLFDMLGNEYEWVQDDTRRAMHERKGLFIDIIHDSEHINDKNARLLRGGSFYNPPAGVRSAYRIWIAPSDRNSPLGGFRPCRTYP